MFNTYLDSFKNNHKLTSLVGLWWDSAFTVGALVWSLVGELRFCMPHGMAKKKKKQKNKLYACPMHFKKFYILLSCVSEADYFQGIILIYFLTVF